MITIGASSSLTIDPTNVWTNLGSITLASGADLYLDGPMTTAGLGSISNSGGTIYLGGTLNNSGQTLNGSSLGLALDGGTISGGTVSDLTFTDNGGTLSGVTFDGPLNLTATGVLVELANGTTVVGSSGSRPGMINATGENSELLFDNTQTFSNATINLSSSGGFSSLYEDDTAGAGNQVLTLDASVTVDVQGYGYIYGSLYSGDGIVNDGTILADATLRNDIGLTIEPESFTNSGTIDLANGDSVFMGPDTFSTTASSVIAIGANSSLYIEPFGAWTNLGSMTLASGAGLYLGGSMTTAGLGSITNSGGTVYLSGSLNNSGQTMNGSAIGLALYGGTISGGTLSGVAFTHSGGTLSGVTFDGPLNLTATGVFVEFANGTTVVGSSGSGPGTINATGENSELLFDNTQTFSNATINLGNSSGYDSLYENDKVGAGQVLTLASSVTVDVHGKAELGSGYSGDGIVNDGTIDQTGRGGHLKIRAYTFINSGTIVASATNGSMSINPTRTFTNNGALEVANGDYAYIDPTTFTTTTSSVITIGANSSLTIDPTNAWTNRGSITVASGADLTLDGSMTINSGATLNLDDGTTLAITNGLDNAGSWTLGGGDTATIGGSLTNSGALDIGGAGISASTTTTAASLENTGVIYLQGAAASGATDAATLDITGAAPTVLAGTVAVAGDAALEFGSGGITTIGSGASLLLVGAEAQILTDDGGRSALTGLAENDGTLRLRGDSIYGGGGASLTTTTSFNNVQITNVNSYRRDGGSAITFGGTLTNEGTFDIGNGNLSAPTTVSANGLNDSGTLALLGSGTALAELIVNGAATTTGDITVGARSEIDVTGSNSFTQSGGSTTVVGSLVAAKINANAGKLDFKSAITTGDGVDAFNVGSLGTLEFDAAVDSSHATEFRSKTSGTLALGDAGGFRGIIEGFAGADEIDLLGQGVTRLAYSGSITSGVLTVFGSTGTIAELSFDGDYRTSSFTFASDGHGGKGILHT